jgi:hypothetical protein
MHKIMKPGRKYFVINTDEPYASDVYAILKNGQLAKGAWPEGDITFEEWMARTWPPQPEHGAEFEDAMRRIHEAAGTRTQVQLAAVLDVRQSSISDAKRRRSIPDGWLLALLRRHGVNPEWIMSGSEPKYLRQAQ